jgi:hypothetical protein
MVDVAGYTPQLRVGVDDKHTETVMVPGLLPLFVMAFHAVALSVPTHLALRRVLGGPRPG